VDAVEEFFDRVMRLVLHPSIIMVSFGFLSLMTGTITLVRYSETYVHYPDVWAGLQIFAGVMTFVSIRWPTRGWIVIAGSLLVVAYSSRSVAILESLLRLEQPSRDVEASFVIASITWMLMAYLAFVIWRRIVIPWAVLMRPTTREEWVIASGRKI
jgi:hypothetical protein